MEWPTADDLGRWMARQLSDTERERATALIQTAAGVVEEAVGQDLASANSTAVLDSDGTADLMLPRWPVTAVAAVRQTRPPATIPEHDYTWSATGILTCTTGRWPTGHRALEVDYTAGYDELPPALARVILELAARVWANPVGAAGEQAGSYSVQWRAFGMELTASQQRVIDRFRTSE